MAHLSALKRIVPENHKGRRHPEDSMDRKVAFSHDQLDHSRFVEITTGDRWTALDTHVTDRNN